MFRIPAPKAAGCETCLESKNQKLNPHFDFAFSQAKLKKEALASAKLKFLEVGKKAQPEGNVATIFNPTYEHHPTADASVGVGQHHSREQQDAAPLLSGYLSVSNL